MLQENNKKNVEFQAEKERLKKRILNGLKQMIDTKKGLQITLVMIMVQIINYFIVLNAYKDFFLGQHLATNIIVICSTIIIITCIAYFLGAPIESKKIRNALLRIGLINNIGEPPELTKVEKGETNTYTFNNCGITPKQWEDAKDSIQSVLGIYIIGIQQLYGGTMVKMKFVKGESIPDVVYWDDAYLQTQTKLALGIGYQGVVTVDMTTTPHMLIAGTTGSGKTWLFKSLLTQARKSGAEVYIIDVKNLDFHKQWQDETDIHNVAYEDEQIDSYLSYAIDEMNRRKALFANYNVSNFADYLKINSTKKEQINAIYIAVDEFAQLFDKTALSKEAKAEVDKKISSISTIARVGRAFGVYLILATQRPDATILPGQIKGMLTVRIAGKCDDVLSQIVLDNTQASREIIGFKPGRFITGDGIQFQGFIHKERGDCRD